MFLLNKKPLDAIPLALCALSSLASLVAAGPALQARAPAIPGPPADPPIVAGDGHGVWHREDPSWGDRAQKLEYKAMAKAADALGLDHAAVNLDHYLDNSGQDFNNNPQDIINDIPSFRESVRATATQYASPAFKAASTGSGSTKTFASGWKPFYATKDLSKDWFFALGGFSYAVSGSVTTKKAGSKYAGDLSYVVYLFDRYNWDSGKGVTIGPFTFTDDELGHMHVVGLAREYIVRGTSGIITNNNWDGSALPTPPVSGGRS